MRRFMCITQQYYYGRRFKCKHLNKNCTKNTLCKSCVLKAHNDLMAQISYRISIRKPKDQGINDD